MLRGFLLNLFFDTGICTLIQLQWRRSVQRENRYWALIALSFYDLFFQDE